MEIVQWFLTAGPVISLRMGIAIVGVIILGAITWMAVDVLIESCKKMIRERERYGGLAVVMVFVIAVLLTTALGPVAIYLAEGLKFKPLPMGIAAVVMLDLYGIMWMAVNGLVFIMSGYRDDDAQERDIN